MIKLKDLLNITCTNATFRIVIFGENRVHTEVAKFVCKDEYRHSDLAEFEKCLGLYGDYTIYSQEIENNCITFNIKADEK
jgi:hypothetical protein